MKKGALRRPGGSYWADEPPARSEEDTTTTDGEKRTSLSTRYPHRQKKTSPREVSFIYE